MSQFIPPAGVPVNEIDTPALLLDAELLEQNINKMAKYACLQKISLRPHVKTHKSPIIAQKQVQAGAIGVTCAKVSEAEVMAQSGIHEILIANQLVTIPKIEKLISLNNHCKVIVAVDHILNAEVLSRTALKRGVCLPVIIECNIGMNRCGTSKVEEAIKLAAGISKLRNLRMEGLMGYEGHTVFTTPKEERVKQCRKAVELLTAYKIALQRAGFPTEIVSAGGTGTYDITGTNKEVTELQVGSYATMDMRYKNTGVEFHLALTLLCTVISRPTKQTAIIDAGLKSITNEFGLPAVRGIKKGVVVSLSEEHGKLQLSEDALDLRVGDKIELIPSHGCTTVNLHERYYVYRNGLLEATWPVAARGAVT